MQYRSDQIDLISAALVKAQGALGPASEGGQNNHHNSSYAKLSDLMAAVREPLRSNGLAIIHIPICDQGGWFLESQLVHESGQWIGCRLPIILGKNGSNQEFGSALTYVKRYAVGCLTGVASSNDTTDDDGNKAEPKEIAKPEYNKPKRTISEAQCKMVRGKASHMEGLIDRVERGWGVVERLEPGDLPKVLFYIAAKKERAGIALDYRDQKDLAEGVAKGFSLDSIKHELKEHQG